MHIAIGSWQCRSRTGRRHLDGLSGLIKNSNTVWPGYDVLLQMWASCHDELRRVFKKSFCGFVSTKALNRSPTHLFFLSVTVWTRSVRMSMCVCSVSSCAWTCTVCVCLVYVSVLFGVGIYGLCERVVKELLAESSRFGLYKVPGLHTILLSNTQFIPYQ